jgi:hypothetical protein
VGLSFDRRNQRRPRPRGFARRIRLSVQLLLKRRRLPFAQNTALGCSLGSKVYLKVIVILLTAMRQGPTPKGQRASPIVRRFAKDYFALADLVERAFPRNHLLEEH